MDDLEAIEALISDLYWQIDEMGPRKIKDAAGNKYNPSYYKRGLENAIARGGLSVAEYVRGYLSKPPSDGYQKLEDADSLDLACESLIADEDKPYAHLFTSDERAAARQRLAPHIEAIEQRNAARRASIDAARAEMRVQGLSSTRRSGRAGVASWGATWSPRNQRWLPVPSGAACSRSCAPCPTAASIPRICWSTICF